MTSPTQRRLSDSDVRASVRTAFGASTEVADAGPLLGGSFGTVWWIDLEDGRRVVLKSGPAPDARLLSYEAGMIPSEAEYLRLVEARAPELPVPRLLYEAADWLIMTRMPGVSLPQLPAEVDTTAARFQSGAAFARLHQVTGDTFGYTGGRACGSTWPDAYQEMIEAALDDAVAWQLPLPVAPEAVREVVNAHAGTLAAVSTPVLLHFDLWDGNVLASMDGQLTGIVDGERFLWGDPFIDFASPALFRDIFDDPDEPFVRGYTSVTPLQVDDGVRRRVWFAQLYLYLLMLVEFPSRGMTPSTEPERWALLGALVDDLLAKLGNR